MSDAWAMMAMSKPPKIPASTSRRFPTPVSSAGHPTTAIRAASSGRTSTRADAADAAQAPEIHTATRNTLFGAVGARRSAGDPEPPFRRYPDAGRVPLPAAAGEGRALREVVGSYAPTRSFEPAPLSLTELASLLLHTNGVTGELRLLQGVARLRAAPSAGARFRIRLP